MVGVDNKNRADFDLAIIGAGIIGACTAWYARKQFPDWRIAVFDRSLAGSGASNYAACLDFAYGHTPLRRELTGSSRALYAGLRNELPGLPIKDVPLYGIVSAGTATDYLAGFTDKHAGLQPDAVHGLLQENPELRLPEGTTVIAGTNASYATRNDIAATLISRFAAMQETRVFESAKVNRISCWDSIYRIETAAEQVYRAHRIIQATGPWINERIADDVVSPVEEVRIKKVIAFHIYVKPAPNDPVYYFFNDDAFLMPRYEDGYWLFSFKCNEWDVVPDASTLVISAKDQADAMEILKKYVPKFVPACSGGRVFCDAYTSDGNPVIRPLAGMPGYIVAGAGGGSGYRLAPGIAMKALQLLK